MTLSSSTLRRLGLLAMLGGIVGLVYFPFHASSYFATEVGAESGEPAHVRAWSEPFRAVAGPALTFADPDSVYLFWGKAMLLVVAGQLCGLVALHAWQRHAGGKLLRAAYRLILVAAGLMAAAVFVLYWIPGGMGDPAFLGLAIPSLLLTMVAYPLYGAATVRARVAPRGAAWLMTVAAFPGIPLMATLVGHLGGGMALLHVTWILLGTAIWRRAGVPGPARDGSGAPA